MVNTLWCVRTWTRHTGESHEGRFATEAEAAAEALRRRQQFRGSGVAFEAAPLPDDMHPDWVPED